MYIITTGIGEHRGIGTLKKCTNKNEHHFNWHWGAPWHWYLEKMYIITTGFGEHRGIGTLKKCKTRIYIIRTGRWEGEGVGILTKKIISAPFLTPAETQIRYIQVGERKIFFKTHVYFFLFLSFLSTCKAIHISQKEQSEITNKKSNIFRIFCATLFVVCQPC